MWILLVMGSLVAAASQPTRATFYEPELQDGIPVLSAQSFAPELERRFDEHSYTPTGRQSADRDFEESAEDDEDEEPQGSSQRGSYENPAFGESRRAARDGEDIEQFFDRHLGPPSPQEAAGADEDALPPVGGPADRRDPDDQYEAAASSPLATIFQTLINAHKRPLVIEATEEPAPATGATSGQQEAASSGSQYVDAAPVAYFAPVAAPSAAYEPAGASQAAEAGGSDEMAQGRGVYVLRQPSLVNRLHTYGLSSQSSNANWRGLARPYASEDQSEYARYPVAASGYQQQREPLSGAADDEQTVSYGLSFGGSADEQPEQVGGAEPAADQANMVDAEPSQQAYYSPHSMRPMYRQSSRNYNNYNQMPPARYMTVRQYQQLQQQQQQQQQQLQLQQQPHQRHQQAYNGARYHKDPSESQVQPVNYVQYSRQPKARRPKQQPSGQESAIARQQLLASLDKQIKGNPYYRQQGAATSSAPAAQYVGRGRGGQASADNMRQQLSAEANDIDMYNSFHSEVDPFKSVTSSSRVVSEPVSEQTIPSGSNQVPSNAERDQQLAHRAKHQLASANPDNKGQQLLSGPVSFNPSQQASTNDIQPDSLRNESADRNHNQKSAQVNLRVRRDDSDDREGDADDDDGVWVDDDDDDDNRQQSSDVNETAQEPEEDQTDEANSDNQDMPAYQSNNMIQGPVPMTVSRPHGYELSPDDLMVYHG